MNKENYDEEDKEYEENINSLLVGEITHYVKQVIAISENFLEELERL